jgi:hypothetical protein
MRTIGARTMVSRNNGTVTNTPPRASSADREVVESTARRTFNGGVRQMSHHSTMKRRDCDVIISDLGSAPNGSRLSCGRNIDGRKELEQQTKRLASEATQFFLTRERPPVSSAC